MKTNFLTTLSRAFYRTGFQLKKHSPEILVVAGVIGTVASAVMACKATTKLQGVLEEAEQKVDAIHQAAKDTEDSKKALTIVYARTGVDLVKLYAPSVALGALSITAMLSSNNILRKRNVALAAAYASIYTDFKEYRSRVVERVGKDFDREMRYGIESKEVEETIVNDDGSVTTVTKTVEVANPNLNTDYSRFFDESCVGWSKDPELNLMYLRRQQSYANDLLKKKGHLFLNEVYDLLGIHRTKAGAVVGWVYDENGRFGDNYVDFGIYDVHDERKRAFVNGYERSILLDFNVDGNILDMI